MIATFDDATLAELVAERPGRARVFEDFGLDYCCHGARSLVQSCREKHVPLEVVAARLAEIDQADNCGDEMDWTTAPLVELIDHIVGVHHAYLRAQFPRLARLFERVVAAHGQQHPELLKAQSVFVALQEELRSHMWKEENVLFPWIVRLESQETPIVPHCGSVNNPIRVMEHEHNDAAEALAALHELSSDFQAPADACPSYRALFHELRELEQDLHRHIHKENNILFPRAIELEMKQ